MACRWIVCLTIVGRGCWTPRFMCSDLKASESTKSSFNEVLLSLMEPLTTLWPLLSVLTPKYAEWHHTHHLILFWAPYILLDLKWPLLSSMRHIKYKFVFLNNITSNKIYQIWALWYDSLKKTQQCVHSILAKNASPHSNKRTMDPWETRKDWRTITD